MNDVRKYLQQLHEEGNYREIPTMTDTVLVDYSTNDYLGLAADPTLAAKFFSDPTATSVPMTSSAARLLAPRQIEYTNLEVFLSLLYKTRRGPDTAALLFNSGYHANSGIIPAIAAKDTLIVADKLVHASIIDGIILSRAPFKRFPHNNFDRLEEIIAKESPHHDQILIVVESIYSMDGDRADLERLLQIKATYPNVRLYVDEAHAFGVLGPKGMGLACATSNPGAFDFIVGTFGKAAASMGAFVITSLDMHDYLVNTSRSFIFSTALPPIMAAWTRYTLNQIVTKDNRRIHLENLSMKLAEVLNKYSKHSVAPSHIQPLIIGNPKKTVELSRQLLSRYGIKVLPIRKPTVPAGTERLRFSLSASIMPRDINNLDVALGELM